MNTADLTADELRALLEWLKLHRMWATSASVERWRSDQLPAMRRAAERSGVALPRSTGEAALPRYATGPWPAERGKVTMPPRDPTDVVTIEPDRRVRSLLEPECESCQSPFDVHGECECPKP